MPEGEIDDIGTTEILKRVLRSDSMRERLDLLEKKYGGKLEEKPDPTTKIEERLEVELAELEEIEEEGKEIEKEQQERIGLLADMLKSLKSLESLRRRGYMPVIVFDDFDVEELKRRDEIVDIEYEILYFKSKSKLSKESIVYLIDRKIEAIIADLDEDDSKIFVEKGVSVIPTKELKVKMFKGYGAINPEHLPPKEKKALNPIAGVPHRIKPGIPAGKAKVEVEGVELADLKKLYLKPPKEEKEEEEAKVERKPGFFERIVVRLEGNIVKKGPSMALESAALHNLEKANTMSDERKKTILSAQVLKEYLEVKLNIDRELTYYELLEEVDKNVAVDGSYKDRLRDFYERVSTQEYSDSGETYMGSATAYNFAREVIETPKVFGNAS
jgi:hypothetical protein